MDGNHLEDQIFQGNSFTNFWSPFLAHMLIFGANTDDDL